MPDAFLDYDVVDVFAERPYAGNQLAVVHGAGDLDDAALLAIAREFGFSETTFPVPIAGDRYRVRIFTPGGEIPFAGHPTIGTSWVLRQHGLLSEEEVVQECLAGEIGVLLDGAGAELTARPQVLDGPVPADALLGAVGLGAADADGEAWVAGTGLSFVHVPVRPDAVARAAVPPRGVLDPALGGMCLYAVTGREPSGVEVHSRVFVPELAVPEDPATGSAATGLGLVLHARGLVGHGGGFRIRQGIEMGRPSLLVGGVHAPGGTVEHVRVAGAVHPIARGRIRPPG